LVFKSKYKKILDVFIIIAILVSGYFIFRNFDAEKITEIKERLNPLYLVAVFFGVLIVVLLRSLRWKLLLKPIKKETSFLNLVEIYASSQMVNYASPGKFGVPVKAFLLKKTESIEISRSTPSLFSEMFLDNFIMFLMLIVAAITGGYIGIVMNLFRQYMVGSMITVLSILLVGTLLIFLFRRRLKKIGIFQNIWIAVKDSYQQRSYFFMAMFLTILLLILSFLCDWLTLRALGIKLSYTFVVMTFSFSTIAGFLSPLPGGIGVREISNAYLFKVFYNLGEIALLVTVLRRSLDYLLSVLLYGYAKLAKYLKTITVSKSILGREN